MHHFTDSFGHKAISSQIDWRFKAAKPPGPHPIGAYFTPLPPGTPRLCAKLQIPRRKTEFVLTFAGGDDLTPLDDGKGRGHYVSYSPVDYVVIRASGQQQFNGPTGTGRALGERS